MKQKLLVGTYSKIGIYEIIFEDTKLEEINSNNEFENCSYLYKNNDIIYSAVEYSTNPSYSNGYLVARNNNLLPISNLAIQGKSPCHITLDKFRNLLYISNYEDGSLNVFSLTYNGLIDKLIHSKTYTPNSHIHYTALSEDYNVLFVIDLGDNTLYAYKIAFDKATFDLEKLYSYHFPAGSCPRHLALNKNNLYVITENSCELYNLLFSTNNGFTFKNKVSILPNNIIKSNNDTGCAIKLSNDTNFIYVTIRGNDSISVFNTSLELIQNISCFGNTPRDIALDISQEFLFCANQTSSNISIFKRDKKTGHLHFESKYPINSPACIVL